MDDLEVAQLVDQVLEVEEPQIAVDVRLRLELGWFLAFKVWAYLIY